MGRSLLLILPLLGFAIGGFILAMALGAIRKPDRRRLVILLRERPWLRVVSAAGMWSVFVLVSMFAIGSGSVLKRGLEALPMAFFAIGLVLAVDARRRHGSTLRCAVCEYDLTGAENSDPAAARCPECGSLWDRPGWTVRGERVWSGRAFALAMLLVLPFFVTVLQPVFGGFYMEPAILRLLPTNSVIAEVAGQTGFTMNAWSELNTRSLSPEQRERLALGLLKRNALRLHAWGDEAKWLAAEAAAGRLSLTARVATLKRYVQPVLKPSLPGTTILADANHAWGLADCFSGWSIFVIPADATDEIPLPNLGDVTKADQAVELARITGRSAWLIAEPRVRQAGYVLWSENVPVMAPDAIAVPLQD